MAHSDITASPCRYLTDVEQFDAAAFGISPAEALVLDPQQRLMLEARLHSFQSMSADQGTMSCFLHSSP